MYYIQLVQYLALNFMLFKIIFLINLYSHVDAHLTIFLI